MSFGSYEVAREHSAQEAMFGRDVPRGTHRICVERPVPLIGENEDGVREYYVEVEIDGGYAGHAQVVGECEWDGRRHVCVPLVGGEISLTEAERDGAEVDYSEACAEEEGSEW